MTLLLVGGITATVSSPKKIFHLWEAFSIGGFIALGFIVCSIIFGFSQSDLFLSDGAAAGSVLYTTSNILHQYRTEQHVAASSLFASVALFFYILQVLMRATGGGDD